jgi:hypothetical protein
VCWLIVCKDIDLCVLQGFATFRGIMFGCDPVDALKGVVGKWFELSMPTP